MKKIMFNDRYGLTQAVLEGKKTMTRRLMTMTLHKKNGGVADLSDAIDSVEEITRKLDEQD